MTTKQDLIDALQRAVAADDVAAANEIAIHIDKGNYDEQNPSNESSIKSAIDNDGFVGAIENVASFASGAIAEPIAGLAGIAASIFGEDAGAGARTVESVKDALTYQPGTTAGQEIQRNVGDLMAPIGEAIEATEDFLGDNTLEITGSPLAATVAATAPTAALELVGLKGARRLKGAEVEPKTPVIDSGNFAESDIPATRGEQMQAMKDEGSFDQLKEEQFLMEQSGDAGDEIRNFKSFQSNEIKKYISDLAPDDAPNVGETVKKAIELRENSARYKRTLAYKQLAEVTKDTDVSLNTTVIGEMLPDSGDLRDFAATQPGQFKAVSDLLAEFGIDKTQASIDRMAKNGISITPLSVANSERFRKRLNKISDVDQTGSTARITDPLKSALDKEFDTAAKALEEAGSEDVSRAAKNARNSHIALKTEFDEKGLIDRLTSSAKRGSRVPKIEESQVYSKMIASSTPVEQFKSVMASLDRAGSRGANAKNAIKSQMILDLIDSGFSAGSRKIKGDKVFGATAFNKRFDQIEPKLKEIMSRGQFARLKTMREISNDLIPPSGAVPKGSAGFFIDSLSGLGIFAMLDKIPGAGPILAEQTKALGRKSKDAKQVRRALSNQNTKEVFNLIKSDYPSLAIVLGISNISGTEEKEQK